MHQKKKQKLKVFERKRACLAKIKITTHQLLLNVVPDMKLYPYYKLYSQRQSMSTSVAVLFIFSSRFMSGLGTLFSTMSSVAQTRLPTSNIHVFAALSPQIRL